MENQLRLQTRRILAWWVEGVGALTIAFVTIWGAINAIEGYVTLGVGVFSGSITAIAIFYFQNQKFSSASRASLRLKAL